MTNRNVRSGSYALGLAAFAVLAIVGADFASKSDATPGAAPSGAAPVSEPTWEQLMGRSVQARKAGAVREAENLLQRAVEVAATFGPHDMRRPHTRMAQAEFHLWSGQPELAEQAYREAVTIGESTGGPQHPEMVSLLEGLANFYYHRERYEDVAPLYARILEIVRVTTPHDAHEEARRLRNLAQVHQLRGKYTEAEPHFLRALRLIEASPKRSPGEIAEYLQAAAECYRAWRKPGEAEPLAARALELIEGVAGPTALDVVPYLETLAKATMETGRPQRAVVLYERAIAIVERVSGTEHSDLAPFLLGLSGALRMQGKLREAETHSSRATRLTTS
jgi:tetratricopeptide (TPR) repeat protein